MALLRERGHAGATNIELNVICFRYGARICELRKRGHRIRTENRGDGVFVFTLDEGQAQQQQSESDHMRRTREEQARAMPLFAGMP